jgi:hypothetical protein
MLADDRREFTDGTQEGEVVAFVDVDFQFHLRLVSCGFVLDFRTDSCHAALVEARSFRLRANAPESQSDFLSVNF